MDDGGVPKRPPDRLKVANGLVERLTASGIAAERIFLDPIVCPVSVDSKAGRVALETLRLIKKELPGAKTICGLSNISFGLPQRRLLNQAFLSIMLTSGLDAAILDPTDKALMATSSATRVLLGNDEHCLGYISAHREGRLT
jgi:5-methyltetrahydrofolate--homocysteine methyltransferase